MIVENQSIETNLIEIQKKKEKFEIAEEKYSTVKKFPSKIVGQ